MDAVATHELFSLYDQAVPFSIKLYEGAADTVMFPSHWHQQTEVLAVTAGELRVVLGSAVHIAHRGDILFINPYEVHTATAGADGAAYVCLLAEAGLRSDDEAPPPRIANRIADEVMFSLMEHIISENITRAEGYDLFVRAHLLLLFGRALRYHRADEALPPDVDERIGEVLRYIDRHFAKPLSTASLAEHFGFSLAYFCRYFKRVTGVTVLDHLRDIRLSHACELLQRTEDSVAEIAERVGFGGTNYFLRQFKLKTGTTPLRFRKQSKKASVR